MMELINITIDDLGRVVIPKFFRKRLEINSRDNLSIEIEKDYLIIKKDVNSDIIQKSLSKYIISFSQKFNIKVIVTNSDKVLYASSNKELLGKNISSQLKKNCIENCQFGKSISTLNITSDYSLDNCYCITLTSRNHVVGLLIAELEDEKLISVIKYIIDLIERDSELI